MADELGELFREARLYGKVNLFTNDNGYHCGIKFNTITHVTLEADSAFRVCTPEEAIKQAIAKAKEIVASMDSLSKDIEQLKLLK